MTLSPETQARRAARREALRANPPAATDLHAVTVRRIAIFWDRETGETLVCPPAAHTTARRQFTEAAELGQRVLHHEATVALKAWQPR